MDSSFLISNFNPILQLFALLNIGYAGSIGVSNYINGSFFGLNFKKKKIISDIDIEIREIEIIINDNDTGDLSQLNWSKSKLQNLKGDLDHLIRKLQDRFRMVYLIGGYAALLYLFLGL